MKVIHSGILDVKYGGPALSTYLTIKGLEQNNVNASLLMAPLDNEKQLLANDINIYYTRHILNNRTGYIPNIKKVLKRLNTDLFHVQGLWLYLSHATACYARKCKIPYVITLRGMLYPQALAVSPMIKKFSLALYQRNDLQQAACIQATCIEEMYHYRALGFSNPVAVIPNPIDLSDLIDREIPHKPVFKIGYLGRVHPRKRIERLIYAMDTLHHNFDDIELVIIGSGDKYYEEFLHKEVKKLNLRNVKFTGFLTGIEKDKAITDLSVLAVPSDFENFGNIVTEALVRGVPVIASKGTPWEELNFHNCGWWINNDQETITQTILKAYNIGENMRIKMGMNGKSLIRNNYSTDVLGLKMKLLYEWILGQTSKPDFVYEV
ncbi:glycosyltransferase [Gabonia massiliensis]|uniref:glycosyltransferase n=1 Tax=Gabonia massiliensis TaxID=1686296 RepID=UPI0006D7B77A|nr:glycosyltransferase [Gabonia massiliensis]